MLLRPAGRCDLFARPERSMEKGMKPMVGPYLSPVEAAGGADTVTQPRYRLGTATRPHGTAWNVPDPMMAAAIVPGSIVGHLRKGGDGGAAAREFVAGRSG